MFQFQYMLSEHDYIEFNKYHAFYSPTSKKNMLIYRLIIPVVFVFCGMGIGVMVDEPIVSYYFYITFGVAAILWVIFFKRLMTRQIKKNIGKIKKSGKLPYQSDVSISFEEDYFVETTKDGEAKVKYSVIERVVTAEEAIYIYTNALQAVILPLTVFSDGKNRDDFIRFIKGRQTTEQ